MTQRMVGCGPGKRKMTSSVITLGCDCIKFSLGADCTLAKYTPTPFNLRRALCSAFAVSAARRPASTVSNLL